MSSLSLLLVVTGASRGFGRAVACSYCSDIASRIIQFHKVRIILLARSTEALSETEETIRRTAAVSSSSLDISCHTVDLSDLGELDNHFDTIFNKIDLNCFDRVIFVHNAGSIGFVGPARNIPSLSELTKHMNMNITSTLWLSIRFLRKMATDNTNTSTTSATAATTPNTTTNRGDSDVAAAVTPVTTIVNVSSLIAKEIFPTFGMYGCNKAARNQFFATLAKELSTSPSINKNVKVLNYAPGPLETAMVKEIRSAEQLDTSLTNFFSQTQIQPELSARKLVKLTLVNEFESGKHIDYYDLPEE